MICWLSGGWEMSLGGTAETFFFSDSEEVLQLFQIDGHGGPVVVGL
jgi:hypothetical protein